MAEDDAVGVGTAKEMGGTRERTIVVIVFKASWAWTCVISPGAAAAALGGMKREGVLSSLWNASDGRVPV